MAHAASSMTRPSPGRVLLAVAATAMLGACNVGTRRTELSVVTIQPDVLPELIPEELGVLPALQVRVQDYRTPLEVGYVGEVRNVFGMQTAVVETVKEEPPEWMELCLLQQFEEIGLDIPQQTLNLGPGLAHCLLRVELTRCYAWGFWRPKAEIAARLELTRFGRPLLERTYQAEGGATMIRAGGTGGYEAALEDTMEAFLVQVIPEIVRALKQDALPSPTSPFSPRRR